MIKNTNENILSNDFMNWDLSILRNKEFPLSANVKKMSDTDLLIALTGLSYEFCIDIPKEIKQLEEQLLEEFREAREKYNIQE